MFWIDLLVALLVGLILTALFSIVIGRTGPWNSLILFFIIIFLGTWAGGLWLRPVGPSLYGYYWITYLIVGILIAVIIAASSPEYSRRKRKTIKLKTAEELQNEEKTSESRKMDLFLSLLIILFLIIIIFGYLIVDYG
jgi:hypothetical protein